MIIEEGQRYKHYKGNTYTIIAVAHHSETGEKMVVYRGEYNDPEFGDQPVWVRPYTLFIEEVTIDGKVIPRFSSV
jgi:hypothetical protein